jgi:hypothetical protein
LYFVILSPGFNVLMRYCYLINRSFGCKAKEGRYARIVVLAFFFCNCYDITRIQQTYVSQTSNMLQHIPPDIIVIGFANILRISRSEVCHDVIFK